MRLTVFLLVWLLVAFPLTAGERDDDSAKEHSLEKGSIGLFFQTTTGMRVLPFHGMVFSGKYHVSDARAVALSIGVTVNSRESDDNTWYDSGDHGHQTESSYDYSIGVTAMYMMYREPVSDLTPFLGLGPSFSGSYNHDEHEYWEDEFGVLHNSRLDETTRWSAGMVGSLGFEFFLTNKISISAEYRMNVNYSWYDRTLDDWRYDSDGDTHSYNKSKYGEFDVDYDRLDLGLVLYF